MGKATEFYTGCCRKVAIMGRNLEFEPDEALRRAMQVFWRLGYERASIGDLEGGTGVGRKSLYRVFRDKPHFFLAALRDYRRLMRESNLAPLKADGAGLAAVAGLLRQLAGMGGTPEARLGCLMCNTALEFGAAWPEASAEVSAYFDEVRRLILRALETAVANGELDLAVDLLEQEANFLLGVVQGLCVMGRAGASGATMNDLAEGALRRLC